MDNTTIAIVIALAVIVLIAALAIARSRKSKAIRNKYGPEFDLAVEEAGGKRRAEAELLHREKRVKKYELRTLEPREADDFVHRWRAVQTRFVDDPSGSIQSADDLIEELMSARGYPVTDFEHRAADLSVEHGPLVYNYRVAHDVAVRHARGEAGTEDLRQAMIHYRELFDDLIGEPVVEQRKAS